MSGNYLPSVSQGVCFSPQHEEYLNERAVPEALAAEQGLRSIDKDEASKLLGYPISCSGLLIPYPGSDGGYCRVRLDRKAGPRFMTSKGQEVPVYIPTSVPLSPQSPIVVTEGPIKALALQGCGICAVGLGGTGTTLRQCGDRHLLNSSWDSLKVSQHTVIIMFDTNRSHNLRVARDEARLVKALELAGVKDIRIARLVSDGENDGPDDILAAQGKTAIEQAIEAAIPAKSEEYAKQLFDKSPSEAVEVLLGDLPFLISISVRGTAARMQVEKLFKAYKALGLFRKAEEEAGEHLRKQDAASQSKHPVYSLNEGVLWIGEGDKSRQLANFSARIVEEIRIDDGISQQRIFVVEGSLFDGTKFPKVRLTPRQFNEEEWWVERWGASTYQNPGLHNQGHLKAAIQSLSSPTKRDVYAHTGWLTVDGKHLFLTAGGALGGENTEVELGSGLEKFNLPSNPQDLPGAVKVALDLLDLAEGRVIFPLFLAAFRAPLMSILPVDGAIHLFGQTGSFKSTTAALIQSFFGTFHHNSLPASFHDTIAALENKLNKAKDVVVVVDEYTPGSTDPNDDVRKKAIQLYRMVGNRAPRARMTSTMGEQPIRLPQALVISTGEELPDGEGIVARTLSINFTLTTINAENLTRLGQQKGQLAATMAGYIGYLAPRLGAIELWAPKRYDELLLHFGLAGAHRRAPAMAAHLALAAELFAEYALDVGVFNENQANEFIRKALQALSEATVYQGTVAESEKPEQRFLELLSELISNGRVTLKPQNEPLDGVNQIGWQAGSNLWLLPESVWEHVTRFARNQGQPFTIKQNAVWSALAAKGILIKPPDSRFTVQRMVGGGKKRRVLELDRSSVEALKEIPEAPCFPEEDIDDSLNTLVFPRNTSTSN